MKEVIEKCNVVVVGPGLGLDPLIANTALAIVRACRRASIPVVLDGDGINLAVRDKALIHGYSQCVLTPNAAEFRRLWEAHLPDKEKPDMSLPVSPDLIAFMTASQTLAHSPTHHIAGGEDTHSAHSSRH